MTPPSPWKKLFISLVLIGASVSYALYLNFGGPDEIVATNTAAVPATQPPASRASAAKTLGIKSGYAGGSQAAPASPPPAPTPILTQQTPAMPAPKGRYADGFYTGNAADAYYGTVQVQATVSGGQLTDVTFLQYPNDRSTSREISAQAIPLLRSEAIQGQSANVDTVSGATQTSRAFRESLTAALAQAG